MNFSWFKTYWPVFVIIAVVIVFFRAFVFEGKLPISSDTIVGLYHPFRDFYAENFPRGIPFKNFLITDPVRQQYPWRELAIDLLKRGELPLWNPYVMGGMPLLATMQGAVFYPLNIIFFLLPFSLAWSLLILFEPLLAGMFIFMYLNNLKLSKWASLFGALVFAFCGFSIAWMEWGTIIHVGLWLPIILLSIDKIFFSNQSNSKFKVQNAKLQFKSQTSIWPLVFIFSLSSSLFAGHLQTFFYVILFSAIYLLVRWWQYGRKKKILIAFIIYHLSFIILTSIQWVPTLQLILESARDVDLNWKKEEWFLPWQHLTQFIAPDFFGNPTTLNYWGMWNYGEFVGYVGIIPLLMALFALFARRDKKTMFFGAILLLSLVFALPTFFAKIPYILNIQFLSTAQPTRLLFIADFSLVVLAALGLDWFLKDRKKVWHPVVLIGVILVGLWLFVLSGRAVVSTENLEVANRNLRLPTILFAASVAILALFSYLIKSSRSTLILCCILIALTIFDLVRFGWKFTPFTNEEYLFPSTKTIEFLQKQEGLFRIMITDPRILPPNFSVVYRLQSIDGYDPLYLRRYGELIAASERGKPVIDPPFGFNRIITSQNHSSKIMDLLGVKYILSLTDIQSPKLQKVFQEGQTIIYENTNTFPRVFFVRNVLALTSKQDVVETMLKKEFDMRTNAVIEGSAKNFTGLSIGTAVITFYSENKVVVQTNNTGEGFLVFTDSFYPTWQARIDGKVTPIYRTDFHFRGLVVEPGKHTIEFSNNHF